MQLNELVRICHQGYTQDFPESSLLECVNPRTGRPLLQVSSPAGDSLAVFVVRELAETYDCEATDEEQIAEAIRVMEAARSNLDNIISALEKRRSA